MSVNAECELEWGDGTYRFRLPIGQVRELEEKRNAGLGEILNRLRLMTHRVDDVREVIRLGLIGGGMRPLDALSLVVRYVDQRPYFECVPHASAILLAAVIGIPDNQPGKKKTESTSAAEPSDSTSDISMETALQWASLHSKSMA